MAQHVDHGLLQADTRQVHGWELARHCFDVAVHLGGLAQEHVHGHVDRALSAFIGQHELPLFSRHADYGKRAALTLAK